MDELKLNLSSIFMKSLVAKLVTKAIQKKFGYKINIELNELKVVVIDGVANVHVNADAKIDNDELMSMLKSIKVD